MFTQEDYSKVEAALKEVRESMSRHLEMSQRLRGLLAHITIRASPEKARQLGQIKGSVEAYATVVHDSIHKLELSLTLVSAHVISEIGS